MNDLGDLAVKSIHIQSWLGKVKLTVNGEEANLSPGAAEDLACILVEAAAACLKRPELGNIGACIEYDE